MPVKSRNLMVRIDHALYMALDHRKTHEGIPVSEQVRRALWAWIDEQRLLGPPDPKSEGKSHESEGNSPAPSPTPHRQRRTKDQKPQDRQRPAPKRPVTPHDPSPRVGRPTDPATPVVTSAFPTCPHCGCSAVIHQVGQGGERCERHPTCRWTP